MRLLANHQSPCVSLSTSKWSPLLETQILIRPGVVVVEGHKRVGIAQISATAVAPAVSAADGGQLVSSRSGSGRQLAAMMARYGTAHGQTLMAAGKVLCDGEIVALKKHTK